MLVPPITTNNQPVADEIENLVDRIIDMKKNSQDTSRLENQIDQLVYQLYDLTPEEIGVVCQQLLQIVVKFRFKNAVQEQPPEPGMKVILAAVC